MNPTVGFTTHLPLETAQSFRDAAKSEGSSPTAMLRKLVEQWLKKLGKAAK